MTSKKPIINFIFLNPSWKKLSPTLKEDIFLALEKTAETLKKDFSQREVGIVLSSDEQVQSLNKTFRYQDKPTNVLSFPSGEKEELGDIVLAYETVIHEAKISGILPLHHTVHLIIHGFLHLLGYDHETENDANHMESLEIKILKHLNIKNPYEDQ
jgi:probable rRNA maturation factor